MPEPSFKKKKLYPGGSRKATLSRTSARHPLNVRPLGNSLLDDQKEARDRLMGHFSLFPEELFMEMLGFVDDELALKALSHTSRVLYAYLYDEELWKKLYTQKVQLLEKQGAEIAPLSWKGSWRLSVLGISAKNQANIQLSGNLLCSDVLFRPFQCAQVNYDQIFKKVIEEEEIYHQDSKGRILDTELPTGRIPRLPEESFTQAEFDSHWVSKPFILTNSSESRWPRWDLSALLERFAAVKFRQEAVQWPLSLYSQYLAKNCDESPLYLFDCNSEAMKRLRTEYEAPKVFQQDLFTVFGKCRPDHAWLIMGSERSGSTFHKDPNYTSAWNTALCGRKLWVMFPPGVTPPGVGTDDEESEVTSPVGIAEWVLSGFYNDAVNQDALIGITFPGECMHVPSGWWHSVINLDDSVALTQNFVPKVKLGYALHFLKNKTAQISGFRPSEVKEALDEVCSRFENDEDEDMQKIKAYAARYNELKLHDFLQTEDCGEITGLPPMPIFELFKKLLVGVEDLDWGLQELDRIEKLELAKLTGKSEAWQKLLETLGFSFGFDVDEDD